MARHAPGLSLSDLRRMTPEETSLVRDEVDQMVKAESAERLELVKGLMRSNGARIV